MKSDDAKTTFDAPQWETPKDGGVVKRHPIAFTKKTKPSVQMTFDLTIPKGRRCNFKIKAVSADWELPEQSYDLEGDDSPLTCVYGWHQANRPFPDQIRFYGPGIGTYNINWQISVLEGDPTIFETTFHRIYLTAGTPLCDQEKRETFFYYACHQPDTDPGTVETDVTHKIWADFEVTSSVPPAPPAFVYKDMYRIDHNSGNLRTGANERLTFVVVAPTGIPEYVNSLCGGWADFLCNVLQVHGYQPKRIGVSATGMALPAGVNDDNGSHAWLVPEQIIAPDGRSVTTGPKGIARGQGADPRRTDKAWPTHTIVRASGKYYDPSYGVGECSSEADYESKATSGFRASKKSGLMFEDNLDFYWPPTGSKTLVYTPL